MCCLAVPSRPRTSTPSSASPGPTPRPRHLHGRARAVRQQLDDHLLSTAQVTLEHRLESVKILPDADQPQHDPRDYGRPPSRRSPSPRSSHGRRRVFCLPVSTEPDRPGEPTLWSAAVDALAVGTDSVRDGDDSRSSSRPSPTPRGSSWSPPATSQLPGRPPHRVRHHPSRRPRPGMERRSRSAPTPTSTGIPDDPSYRGGRRRRAKASSPPQPDLAAVQPAPLADQARHLHGGRQRPHRRRRRLRGQAPAALAAHRPASPTTSPWPRRTPPAPRPPGRATGGAGRRPVPRLLARDLRGLLTHAAEWTPSCAPRSTAPPERPTDCNCCAATAGAFRTSRRCSPRPRRRSHWSPRTSSCPSRATTCACGGSGCTSSRGRPTSCADLGARGPAADHAVLLHRAVRLATRLAPALHLRLPRPAVRPPSPLETSDEFVHRVNRDAQSPRTAPPRPARVASLVRRVPTAHLGSLHQDEVAWHRSGTGRLSGSRSTRSAAGGRTTGARTEPTSRSGTSLVVSLRTADSGRPLHPHRDRARNPGAGTSSDPNRDLTGLPSPS